MKKPTNFEMLSTSEGKQAIVHLAGLIYSKPGTDHQYGAAVDIALGIYREILMRAVKPEPEYQEKRF